MDTTMLEIKLEHTSIKKEIKTQPMARENWEPQ